MTDHKSAVTVAAEQRQQDKAAAKGGSKTPAHLASDAAKAQEIAILEARIKELKGDAKPVVQEYPRWRHHKDRPAVLVHSKAEDQALGAGFHDSPVLAEDR